jgi:hypothetical protein
MAAEIQVRINTLAAARARDLLQLHSKYFALTKPLAAARAQCLRQLPGFWPKALSVHYIRSLCTEKDWEVLQTLEDVIVDEFPSRDGSKTIKIVFDMGSNAAISNASLWLTVTDTPPRETTTSGLSFNEGFQLSDFDESEKESIFRLFASEGNRCKTNAVEKAFDFAYCIQTDFWVDPFKYYEIATGEFPSI